MICCIVIIANMAINCFVIVLYKKQRIEKDSSGNRKNFNICLENQKVHIPHINE